MAKKKATFKGVGKGRYVVTDKKSKNYKKTFTKDLAGNHVYKGGKVVGKRTVPFDASAPIKTQAEFDQRTNAATQLRYGEQQTDIDAAKRASAQQSANVGNWFEGYKQDVARANAQHQQNVAQTQGAIYGQANLSRGQDNAQSAQLDQAGQAAASLRGATMAPSVAPQAAAGRQALSNSFGGMVGAQGVAQGAYGAQQQASAGGMKAQALTNEQGNRRKLDVSQQKLEADKGAYKVEYGDKLRGAEHTKRLEIAAYGLNEQKAASDAADDAADNAQQKAVLKRQQKKDKSDAAAKKRKDIWDKRAKDQTYRESVAEHGRTEADRQWKRDHPKGSGGSGGGSGGSSFTPTQLRAGKTKYREAFKLAKDTGDAKPGRGKTLQKYLASKGYKDPVLTQAAAEKAIYGGVVTPGLRAKVREAYGFTPKLGKKRKPSKGSPSMPGYR